MESDVSPPAYSQSRRRGKRRRRRAWLPRPPALRDFAKRHRLRFTEGNHVTLYGTGPEGLEAMLAAIESAVDHVHLETYILRPDATGRRFLRALTEQARAGVEVRVVVDALGSWTLDDRELTPLREAGGEVVWFNPVGFVLPRLGARRRDHRKILVVDGEVGFTGGLNIGDEYTRGPESGARQWRDAHVRIQGPAVRDLQAVFLESWFRADGPDLPWHTFLDESAMDCGDVRCAVVADGPIYRRRRMRDLVVAALDSATEAAAFESPYFAPGRRVLEALGAAAERGIRVRLLLAARSDHPILYRAARAILTKLVERGVEVREFTHSMLHSKLAVFDDSWAILGTTNLDRQSLEHSHEVNLILSGGDITKQLSAHLREHAELSRPVAMSDLQARPAWQRLCDWAASLLLWFV